MRVFTYCGLLTALSTAHFSLAAPSRSSKIKESINPPTGWIIHGVPPPDHNIVLRIGLPRPNFHVLESHLYEVSDPEHPRYGAHLSNEEVHTLIAPHPESVDAVTGWLTGHGIELASLDFSPARDWVKLTIPVSLAEELLDTTYNVWKNNESGDYTVRTTSWSLPEDLHEHVDVIQPTTMFAQFKRMKSTIYWPDDAEASAEIQPGTRLSTSGVDASCNTTITVQCLRQLYNFDGYIPSHQNNSIGITGYLEEFANIEDLQSFYADQRPDALKSSYRYISINNGTNSQNISEAGVEANLDVQFAFGISYPIKSTFWSTGGRPPFLPDQTTLTDTNEPYAEWLDYVLRHRDTPLTISTSYGDSEQTVPRSYASRVCAEFGILGAKGVSLLFSSGDGGVGDGNDNPATHECYSNDGKNTTKFLPIFPGGCPFVTAVGGTQGYPEIAVSRFYSGGGFSNYFARPPYQKKAVQAFLDKLPKGTYQGLYNESGRAYPDISAQGDFYRIFYRGKAIKIGGTSASAPAAAGIVALLNDVRLKAGKSPLGFLNPLIYSKDVASTFNDVTVGHNAGCGTPGFNATAGWDPVTGLGTPNFGKLKDLITKH